MHSFAPSVRRAQAPSTALRGGDSRIGAPTAEAPAPIHELASIPAFPSTRGYAMEADETRKPPPEEDETRAALGQGTKASPAEPTPDETAPPPAPAPPAPAPPAACAITSTTTLSAPDGSPDTRRTVGVREEVTFTVTGSADWKASSGDPTTSKAASSSFVWRAPRRGERPTIAASIVAAPVSCAFQMEVVEPASLAMTKISEDAFPKGQQGAGMICDATFAPTSVSFAQVEWLEIGKDAINVKGYWEKKKKKEGSDLAHHPNPDWVQLNNLNRHGDHAASSGWPPPWEDGSRDWPIPNNFRTVGEAGPGKFFKDTTQAFVITPNGTTTITKAGDHVTRTP